MSKEKKTADLLKEAIADAKAVRQTALESAKMALEEAINPKLQKMFSEKIEEELDENEQALEEGEQLEEQENYDEEEGEVPGEQDTGPDEYEEEDEEDLEEALDSSGIGTGDNVQPADVASDDSTEDPEGPHDPEEMAQEDEDYVVESQDELDLESIIEELESETLNEQDEDDDDDEEEEEEEEEVNEDINLRGIFEDEDEEVEIEIEPDEGMEYEQDEYEDDDDEILMDQEYEYEDDDEYGMEENISKMVDEARSQKALRKAHAKISELKSEVSDYREAVEYMKSQLNEVNILNAKLLFTNKLFRNFNLDEKSKIKIIENFDRAQTTREIKLVYATLAENLQSGKKKVPGSVKRITEGASKAIKTTKPKKEIITESSDAQLSRIQKLAGIKK